jgi:glycosyltransferase involved in cell wall biosynthesis
MINAGYDVVAVAPFDGHVDDLLKLGCKYLPIRIDSKGINPWSDLLLFFRFLKIFRNERPNFYLGYTIKPNIYGSLAAHIFKINVVNNIAGLGSVFSNTNWLTLFVKNLYRLALVRSKKVFFQNDDDINLFLDANLVNPNLIERLPGSGVDLKKFVPENLPDYGRPKSQFRFLLIARLLWDKGVGEYVEAARLLRERYPKIEFCVLGFLDVKNPRAITSNQMDNWVLEKIIQYLGSADDVRPHIASADCVVLPSYYREGVPRTLLEAASMGRPIITTNAVGCRDVVEEEVNGYLCKPRDSLDLALKMERMLQLSQEERLNMGKRGRKKIELEFDEQIVINRYLNSIIEVAAK